MKPKTIITTILLLFVAASITYLAIGALWKSPDIKTAPAGITPADPTASVPDSALTPAATDPSTDKSSVGTPATNDPKPISDTSPDTYIVVYYFHGNYRCITCRTIEMYTREAVNGAFLKELGNGSPPK